VAIGAKRRRNTAIHPDLARSKTCRFVRGALALGLEIALDYCAAVLTGSSLGEGTPNWFVVRPDGTIQYAENPPKKYQDIVPLNSGATTARTSGRLPRRRAPLDRHGVRTFRVETTRTPTVLFWSWLIEDVKREHPDVIFLAEAVTRPNSMQGLAKPASSQFLHVLHLAKHRGGAHRVLTELTHRSWQNFRGTSSRNTPDILHEYLQKGGRPAFLVRLVLARRCLRLRSDSGFESPKCAAPPRSGGVTELGEVRDPRPDWERPATCAEIAAVNRSRRENTRSSFTRTSRSTFRRTRRFFSTGSRRRERAADRRELDPLHAQETMVHVTDRGARHRADLDIRRRGLTDPGTLPVQGCGTTCDSTRASGKSLTCCGSWSPRREAGMSQETTWHKDAIIYELHVKAFRDGNRDGYGDFQGLIEKLPYLEELGVNCIWLLPSINPRCATTATTSRTTPGRSPLRDASRRARFINEAHDRGIRVITELGRESTVRSAPLVSKCSPRAQGQRAAELYVWSDTEKKYEKARIIFKDFEVSKLEPGIRSRRPTTGNRFFHHQPDLNFDNKAVRQAVMRVMRFWLNLGVDGMRLDAVPCGIVAVARSKAARRPATDVGEKDAVGDALSSSRRIS